MEKTNAEAIQVISYAPVDIKEEVLRELDYRKIHYRWLMKEGKLNRVQANTQFMQLKATIEYIEFFQRVYSKLPRRGPETSSLSEFLFNALQEVENNEISPTTSEIILVVMKALVEQVFILNRFEESFIYEPDTETRENPSTTDGEKIEARPTEAQ